MISYQQWMHWNDTREFTCYPYVEVFDLPQDRIPSWTSLWQEAGETAFVLESGKGGRYTFVSAAPTEWVTGDLDRGMRIAAGGRMSEELPGPPLHALRRWMAPYRSPKVQGAPKFLGGIVGFLAYDVVRTLEKLPATAVADSPVPDYLFMRIDELWIVDHQERKLYCAVHAVRTPQDHYWREEDLSERYEQSRLRVRGMHKRWERWMTASEAKQADVDVADTNLDIDVGSIPGLEMSLASERFQEAVRDIQNYIAQGDVFQVNLSVRQSKTLCVPPETVYELLRRINPSPYMAYLRIPGGKALVSASPELLIRLEDGRVSTRPIAGTRPRGADDGEDGQLQRELLLNEKERAEHVMLVDLERNDLGRISAYGTVRVKEFMAVERYSHVMHIVSEVEGKLADGKDPYDVIAAVFPGGTITGAPKIRTMEIIEQLEPVRRGPYTGSIGWIDYNGNLELNITIRTLVYADGAAHVQSGAGIVIDSVPENEFRESLNKAKALWKAVEIGERAHKRDSRAAESSREEKREAVR
ncbi:anthranilate synthase component I family protein [Paenibacillus alkalitolerans]|uniref:anthranilate synthase component I family protein n=1 Tax=Paenibacillus alkalitolerans TaxID=2799335 RepID=UPI0018F2D41A|nr:anthranilate synthase component I family protein [Paenibacillus alkalitolerans]